VKILEKKRKGMDSDYPVEVVADVHNEATTGTTTLAHKTAGFCTTNASFP